MEFKVGDVVRLKSIGPKMTVCMVSEKDVNCMWYYEGAFHSMAFNPEVLSKVEKDTDEEQIAGNSDY